MIDANLAPLSLEQERMWLLAQLHGPVPALHERGAAWLDGDVEPARLGRAVAEVVARHEVLRTTLGEHGGRVVQVVAPASALELRVVELGSADEPATDGDALAMASEAASIGFDLERGPLLRTLLFRLHARRHLLVVVMHHLISDGDASIDRLLAEVFARYHGAELPARQAQYRDYAATQYTPEARARAQQQLEYWAEELAGVPAALALATDRPRPAARSFAGACAARDLEGELAGALADFARAADTDLYTLLLAGLQTVLHRHSRQDDVLVGAPLAGRDDPRFCDDIGYFGNPVVFRGRFAGDPSLRELVRRTHRAVQEGRRHGEVSFKSVVERLAPARDPSRTPLFQVLFHLRPPAAAPRVGASFTLTPVDVHLPHVAYDLVVTARPLTTGDGLALRIEYNRDLFDPDTVDGLLDQWEQLLRAGLRDPDAPVSRLPLMDDARRREVLRALDARDAPARRGPDSIHAQVTAHARRDPDAPALRFGAERRSYGELDRRSNQVAHLLRKLGVGPDVLVGVCMERSVDMIVAMLAVLKAGGAYVPLDPTHPAQRLAFMLADSGAAVLLTAEAGTGRLPETDVTLVRLDADGARIDAEPEHAVEPLPGEGPHSLAYAMYTSGSTGRPKGACISHHGVQNLLVDTDYLQVEPGDRVAQTANASFDAATMEIWGALLNGAELVAVPREVALAPTQLARAIAEQALTIMILTPALFAQVAREVPGAFAPLKTLLCGGDTLDPEAVRRVLEGGPPRHLINAYGPTEATACATWYRVAQAPAAGASIPIGRPIARVAIYVLDAHREPVPAGVCGEIWIAGEGVGHGYLRRPELTAERFVRDPFAPRPDARMYRTGDLGRRSHDGQLEFHGRIDQQVKIRGFRIELGEIEAALAEQPGVRQVAVVAVAAAGDRRIVAHVAPERAAFASDEALVRALRGALALRLPDYMIPAEFVVLDALPFTPNGKLDRDALPAPDAGRGAADHEFVAPRSELEESLADIWRELLGRPRIGVHDDFFALGGHSLHAVQLFSRVRAVFGVELRFQEFFARATIAELAALMRRARSAASDAGVITPAPRGRPLPLSFGQERLWFLHRFAPESRAYNCMYPYRLTGALDLQAFDRSLRALVQRHEILRTTYAELDGQPVQIVHAEGACRLGVTDLEHLTPAEREAEARALVDAEAQRLFDLERGPLLRAGLIKLGPQDALLWLHFHHLTMDGWSTELAFGELAALYAGFSRGLPAPLPALPLQYADFAVWQRERPVDAALLQFWNQALLGAPPRLDLPSDRPRPAVQSFEGAAVAFELAPALTRSLRELSARHGMTLTMVLLAAYAALLHRHARVDDLVIGMPSANRDRVELERTMGFFVNTLAIRVDLAGDPSVAELLGRVRRVCLAAYDHDALPFERLVQELRPTRDAGHNPVVQVAFAPQPPAGRDLQLHGLVSRHVAADARKAIFDLSFYSWDRAGGVAGIFEYCADRFERAAIERMVGHLSALLTAMAADPGRPVSTLPLLGDDERRLLATWGAGPVAADQPRTVLDRFEAQARRSPDALAVTSLAGSWTYRALDRRANRLAGQLRELGVTARARVGVCVERSPELLVALLAVWKAGGAYVPLDPDGGAERLAGMLADVDAAALIVGPRIAAPSGYAGPLLRLSDELAGDDAPPPRATDPDELAYVVYTSGSTGRPKGVLVEHRGLTNLVAWHTRRFAVTSADRATLVASPGFDASVWEIWPYLCAGASLAVPAASLRVSPPELRDWLVRQAITISFQPTAIAEELLRLTWPARCALRVLLTGGDRLRGRPGAGLPFELVNNYGPTEATVVTTSGPVLPLAPGEVQGEPTIGRPIDGVHVHVLDARGQQVPAGVAGELCIGGVGLARGYHERPALTAERFIPDPFSNDPRARLYRSGDLVRWRADGSLEFLGRTDEQIKLRGYRIEPGEIEVALREHPSVRDAAVLAVGDGPEARLVAYFTRAAEDRPAEPSRRAHGEHVSAWRDLYDETYARERPGADPGLDIVGWNSSYTGEPIDAAAMRAWRDHTVERILGLRPARVWELGCGTGLLLLQLAPTCASYLGTDFSQRALDVVRPRLTRGLSHVTLQRRDADDFTDLAPGQFDAVVLNSIAQYFPDEAYLRSVLAGAVRSVVSGGVVFVGDVRSLPLLAAFRASVERAKAGPDVSVAELRARVARALALEEELCADPDYFLALADELPRVAHVEAWLKRGRGDDEMTRFRYDVALFIGEAAPPVEPDRTLAWAELGELAELERRLAARELTTLELLGVPNARVIADVRAAAALQEPARPGETLAALAERTRAVGVEPEALWQLGERLGYAVRVSTSPQHGPGHMDALFERSPDPRRPRAWTRPPADHPLGAQIHEPARARRTEDLAPALRHHLARRLPEYMVPAHFVQLDTLPRTLHGKLDRRALPAPTRPGRPTASTPVATDLEATLSAIWRRLLDLEHVGLDDAFFDLGGHSLLLARVRAAISTQLGADVPIVELFRHPTIRGLAAHLRGPSPAPAPAPAPRELPGDAVAIVGMAGRFPGAADIAELWANLRDGVESITFVDDAALRALGLTATPGLVPASGVLDEPFAFDAELFGVSPSDAALMDPQHRVFLECAWAAMEHAGHRPIAHPGTVGVFAGCDAPSYWMERIGFCGGPLASEYYRVAGANMADGLTTRTAHKLGLRGPAVTVLSACSTSLVAVHLACRSLLAGECDLVLAGGVAIHPPSRIGHVHEQGSLVSPDGHCRPFDADAAGTVNGSGVAVVALRRLADAIADGDTIHAVLRGSAVRNDGADKLGYTAPGVDGQAETVAQALAAAAVDPASVGYIEAHGTGTRLGDPIEVAALTRVFRRSTAELGFCALGSLKGNLGHLGAASGVTGLIKATLALAHQLIPPTLHFRRPNPELALATSPFFVPAAPLPWPRAAAPRRAGVSAFGVGGTNAHVVLEEAPLLPPSAPSRPYQLLTLSARSEAALATSAARLTAHLQATPQLALADVAHTLRVGRVAMSHRRVFIARDGRLGASVHGVAAAVAPPVVFMFPGGGTQQPGMGRELYRCEPVYRDALDRCAHAFAAELGFDIRSLLFPADDARAAAAEQMLRPCENLAVIFATEVALAELLFSWGIRPAAVTGHSLGEYAAAHVAGVLTLAGAVALIATRGRIYEALPPDTETLIVRVSEAELAPRLDDGVSLAAVNGPEVCVISGTSSALRELAAALVREGRDVKRLAIATAAHSALVEPFLERLTARAAALPRQPPRFPVISNLTGRWLTDADACDPSYWARHLRGTVRFADGLTTLLADPTRALLEVGPGHTLSKLAARHPHGGAQRIVLPTMAQPGARDSDADTLLTAVGRLWCAGVELDAAAMSSGEPRRRVPLPTYPFARTRHIHTGPRASGTSPAGEGRITLELAAAAHGLDARLRRLRDAVPVADTDAELLADLDRACAIQMHAYLFGGTGARAGTTLRRSELLTRLGVTREFTRYVDFFLDALAEEGVLRRDGDTLELLAGADELPSPAALAERFAARHPDARPVLALIEHCGAHYGPALRGDLDNTSVLHPDGSYALVRPAEELLLRTSQPKLYIRMVRDLVLRAVRSAGGAPLRILEFGGGQGRLTWELAPLLDGMDIEYWFTDVSRYFTLKAEERARAEALDGLRFSRLDLDEDPVHQGYPRGHFDIIVGLDALHVARDLARSVAGLHDLLRADGLMVIVEVTRVARWHTAIWGLESGWWSFTDTELRRDSPTLPAAAWQALFAAQGFRSVHVLPGEHDERDRSDHVLIAAQAHPAAHAAARADERPAAPTPARSSPGTPPRTDQERAIAALWQQALGLPCEDVHANFFALGGDSLIAVGLLTRLRAAFSVRLDSHALLERPTIAQLSAWIDEQRRAVADADAPVDNLVQLRAGRMQRPLFLVHAVGGHVYSYVELANHLGLDQAVLGLRAPAAEQRRSHAGSIEAIARAYLERVRAVQPEGPYRIGGWSFGGAVAFEMAAQLRAAGQEALPLLIDSPAPTLFRDVAAAVEARALRLFTAELGVAELDAAETAALEALPPAQRLSALLDRLRRSRSAPDIVEVGQLEQLLNLLSDNIRTWCRYEPRPYPGTLLQFRARDPASFLAQRERELADGLGWEPYARRVESHEIPGDHFSIVRGENVEKLAAAMRPYLQD